MSKEATYISDATFWTSKEGLTALAKFGSDCIAVDTLAHSFLAGDENTLIIESDLVAISHLLRIELKRVLEIVKHLSEICKRLNYVDEQNNSFTSEKILTDKQNLNKKRSTYSNNAKGGSKGSAVASPLLEQPPNNGLAIAEQIYQQSKDESIQNNRITEDQNLNKNSVNQISGKTCFHDRVWLSEEEVALAKRSLRANDLEDSDFDLLVYKLSDFLVTEGKNYGHDKHYKLLTSHININAVHATKRQKLLTKQVTDKSEMSGAIDFEALRKKRDSKKEKDGK